MARCLAAASGQTGPPIRSRLTQVVGLLFWQLRSEYEVAVRRRLASAHFLGETGSGRRRGVLGRTARSPLGCGCRRVEGVCFSKQRSIDQSVRILCAIEVRRFWRLLTSCWTPLSRSCGRRRIWPYTVVHPSHIPRHLHIENRMKKVMEAFEVAGGPGAVVS